jgi:hypothetical protein
MKITIEVEPVLCDGRYGDKTYYAFVVTGLPNEWGAPLVLASTAASYPGNDAVREFINKHAVKEAV